MKLVGLIKKYLSEFCSKIRVDKYFFYTFPVLNGLKLRKSLSPLLSNFAFEYAVRKFQENYGDLELNGAHQLLVHADDIILFGDNINTILAETQTLLRVTKFFGQKINTEKTSI